MRKAKSAPRFGPGDAVRVKPGVIDPDFPDIPFGGWAGTVAEIHPKGPTMYLVCLNERTLKNIHPVYLKRCERDGLEADQVWLLEVDLEQDTGGPVEIEQPAKIVTRPLNMKHQDDRIRAIFGLTSDDPLPEPDDDSLQTYFEYLAGKLSLPFDAKYSAATGLFRSKPRAVNILELLDPDEFPADECGLLCGARSDKAYVMLPLIDIKLTKGNQGNPNKGLVEDFSYWFANW
jgi:hypothetical protein